MIRRPPKSPLFPSTSLFRSAAAVAAAEGRLAQLREGQASAEAEADERRQALERMRAELERLAAVQAEATGRVRSEEHTSELQSRQYLVCRPLLATKHQGPFI